MRTAQELANELTGRMRDAMRHAAPAQPIDRSCEILPGGKFRDQYGRMVTVTRVSQLRVMYYYEGYRDICETSRREFDLKFRAVQL